MEIMVSYRVGHTAGETVGSGGLASLFDTSAPRESVMRRLHAERNRLQEFFAHGMV